MDLNYIKDLKEPIKPIKPQELLECAELIYKYELDSGLTDMSTQLSCFFSEFENFKLDCYNDIEVCVTLRVESEYEPKVTVFVCFYHITFKPNPRYDKDMKRYEIDLIKYEKEYEEYKNRLANHLDNVKRNFIEKQNKETEHLNKIKLLCNQLNVSFNDELLESEDPYSAVIDIWKEYLD